MTLSHREGTGTEILMGNLGFRLTHETSVHLRPAAFSSLCTGQGWGVLTYKHVGWTLDPSAPISARANNLAIKR